MVKCYVCGQRFGSFDKIVIRKEGRRILVYHAHHIDGKLDNTRPDLG